MLALTDGFPQRSSILWQVSIDLHLPAWHQASRCLNFRGLSIKQFLYARLDCMSEHEIYLL